MEMVDGDVGWGWWMGMVDGDGGRRWWMGRVDGDGGCKANKLCTVNV